MSQSVLACKTACQQRAALQHGSFTVTMGW